MDTVDAKTRSKIMARVKGKDTKPELFVRKALYEKGYRYRLHYKKLPGHPDLVFPKYKAAIFIHGCFWHRHGCYKSTTPSTRVDYWLNKFEENVERDKRQIEQILALGWRVMIIWECVIKGKTKFDSDDIVVAITKWLKSSERFSTLG